MAALAKAIPRAGKKLSEVEKRRSITNYGPKRFSGYAAIPMAAGADGRRITSPSGWRVLSTILEECLGRRVAKDAPFLEETEAMSMARLAELSYLEERTCQREFKLLQDAEIISVQELKKGLYVISPLFRTWHKLPSYTAGPVAEPEQEADHTDPEKERVTTRVTKKPVHVPAGKKSKEYPVECGVSALQFDVRQLDADCSAVVQNGVLCVTLEPRWNAGKSVSGLKKAKEIPENLRHGCRQKYEGTTSPSKQTKKRTTGENAREYVCDHPRAEELAALFDPFLLKSCGKSLSGDISCLQSACEAIKDTDHDFLVKAAVSRASRPISGPPAVISICKEISSNFLRSKSLPAEKKLPTREEIDAIVEREKAELAAENARRRRRA